jgi:hypothetical protein
MIPCKEIKCLTYAACKNRNDIKCPTLLRWFNETRNELKDKYNFSVRHEAAWIELSIHFPDLFVIRGNAIIDHEYRTGYKDGRNK